MAKELLTKHKAEKYIKDFWNEFESHRQMIDKFWSILISK